MRLLNNMHLISMGAYQPDFTALVVPRSPAPHLHVLSGVTRS